MNGDSCGILVSLFMSFYGLLWKIALPFVKRNPRIKPTARSRLSPSNYSHADIWIQAASAGEAKIALSLLEKLSLPESMSVLVTTFTAQGMEMLEQGKDRCNISNLYFNWFPFDCPGSIDKILEKISPSCMVLLETELWPGLLYALKKRNIPVLVINARMSQNSFRQYGRTKFLWRKLSPDRILVISSLDAKRFQTIFPASRVRGMPNIKFAHAARLSSSKETDESSLLERWLPADMPCTVFASIRRQEEPLVQGMIKDILAAYPNQNIALFPRHMHRIKHWKKRLKKAGMDFCLRSDLESHDDFLASGQIILWDRFGEMQQAFLRAQAVFVGGSLTPLGGQNFMEPLLAGAFTITGPYTEDFSWVGEEIFAQNLVQRAKDARHVVELLSAFLKLERENEEERRSCLRKQAQEYVASFQNGAEDACRAILECVI